MKKCDQAIAVAGQTREGNRGGNSTRVQKSKQHDSAEQAKNNWGKPRRLEPRRSDQWRIEEDKHWGPSSGGANPKNK